MQDKLKQLKLQAAGAIKASGDLALLEKVELKYFGRKEGELNKVLKSLKNLSVAERKQVGRLANEIKNELLVLIKKQKQQLGATRFDKEVQKDRIDPSQPGKKSALGSLNPITIIQQELEELFSSFGFMVLDGPELESDYYNFTALNIPFEHPTRDDKDTFYVNLKTKDERLLLRTETSAVQVRAMQKYGAPIRAIVPGRVFRNEATDASHDHTFYQLEGLMVDENISIVNLIAVMKTFLKGIFKKDIKIRLRPGHFPFVEPGFELDIECQICNGKGCRVCSQTGWVELVPCGMVHPNVLKAGNIDPQKYSGFAFGLGLNRLVMMRYGINDIRLFCGGDLRFLKQFA